MTKEEAIKELKINKTDDTFVLSDETIELAIKALEQESIIDKIMAEIEQIADEEQKHDEKWAIGLRYAVKIIDKYNVERRDKE